MSIADMISALGGRRGRALMYKEDPIYGAPDVEETIDIPGLEEKDGKLVAGKSDPSTFKVPGEVRQVGSMPPRLSRLGGLLNLLPLAAQGAMDGVMAPTTHSGLDFVSGFQAAGKAKQERDMLAESRKRQAQQDAINMELHRSQIEENRAQGRRADAQAQMAMQPKVGKPQGPSFSQQIDELVKQGYTKQEAASIVMKQWDPRLGAEAKPVLNYEQEIANEIKKLRRDDPNYDFKRKALEDKLVQWQKDKGFSKGTGRPTIKDTEQGISRLQVDPKTGEFKWVVDPVVKGGVQIADSANPIPKSVRPPKVTASDKRYEDQRSIAKGVAYVEAEAAKNGYTPEIIVGNVLNPSYYRGIPEVDQYRKEIADYFRKRLNTKGGNRFSPTFKGGGAPPVAIPKDPLGIR